MNTKLINKIKIEFKENISNKKTLDKVYELIKNYFNNFKTKISEEIEASNGELYIDIKEKVIFKLHTNYVKFEKKEKYIEVSVENEDGKFKELIEPYGKRENGTIREGCQFKGFDLNEANLEEQIDKLLEDYFYFD